MINSILGKYCKAMFLRSKSVYFQRDIKKNLNSKDLDQDKELIFCIFVLSKLLSY